MDRILDRLMKKFSGKKEMSQLQYSLFVFIMST